MDRHLAAYLLIAALLVGLAVVVARVRHYSRANVVRRQRLADAARWAARADKREQDKAAGPGL